MGHRSRGSLVVVDGSPAPFFGPDKGHGRRPWEETVTRTTWKERTGCRGTDRRDADRRDAP